MNVKMVKYILYKRNSREVEIVSKKPSEKIWSKKGYGFAEGPLKNNKEVCDRLGMMHRDIPKKLKSKC
jgi:hypothetical protein